MKLLMTGLAVCALLGAALKAPAAVTVGVDPSANWIGYMNVSELPSNGGTYLWGSPWGTADLDATFTGDVATLTPNTSIARDPNVKPTDPYWWKADGTGNKNMDANFYVEDSATLPGQEVTFTGNVLSNTLVSPYTSVAFIKDFAPDYSSMSSVTAPLNPGVFSITLPASAAGHHIQYGFETIGPNARLDQVASLGAVQVTAAGAGAIPEPATMTLLAAGSMGLLARRRARKA